MNITPAARAATSSWTTTATPSSSASIRRSARYEPTCGSAAAIQHCSICSTTSPRSDAARKVRNWPAQLTSVESFDRRARADSEGEVSAPLLEKGGIGLLDRVADGLAQPARLAPHVLAMGCRRDDERRRNPLAGPKQRAEAARLGPGLSEVLGAAVLGGDYEPLDG